MKLTDAITLLLFVYVINCIFTKIQIRENTINYQIQTIKNHEKSINEYK